MSPTTLAPFNPTSSEAIDIALKLLIRNDNCKNGLLYDIGCGDGRVLIQAAKEYSLRGIGIEYDEKFANRAKETIGQDELLQSLVSIKCCDATTSSLSDATLIFLYLVPKGLEAMKPALSNAMNNRKDLRIVTNMFAIPGWTPSEIKLTKHQTKLYLYTS